MLTNRMFGLVLLLLLTAAGIEAQTPSDSRVLQGVTLFEGGEFQSAASALRAISDAGLSNRDRAIRDLYLGVIALALQDQNGARVLMQRALDSDPEVRLDPSLHAPSRIAFFQQVREEHLRAAPQLVSMRFINPPVSLEEGGTARLSVQGIGPDGQEVEIQDLTWAVDNASVGFINNQGLFSSRRAGDVMIVARSGDVESSHRLTVTPVVMLVSISGGDRVLNEGEGLQLETSVQSRGGVDLIGTPITWSSMDPSIVEVSPSGRINARRAGVTTITASAEGLRGSVMIEVRPVVAEITIAGPSGALRVGSSVVFEGLAFSSAGMRVSGARLEWVSSDPSVATVDSAGRVVGVATGRALISARAGSVTTSRAIEVAAAERAVPVQVRVARVQLDAPQREVSVGDTVRVVGSALDAQGNALTNRVVTFQSTDERVLRVLADGRVIALASGTAEVIGSSSDGPSERIRFDVARPAPVVVREVPVARVVLSAFRRQISVGDTLRVLASAVDRQGNALPDRVVNFSSSDSRILRVLADGRVIALAPGAAEVIGTSADGPQQRIRIDVTRAASTAGSGGGAWLGLLVPGAGQFASGQDGAGVMVLLAAGGAVAAGYLITQERQLCGAPVGIDGRCPQRAVLESETERPYLTAGIGAAAGITVLAGIVAISQASQGTSAAPNSRIERFLLDSRGISAGISSDGGIGFGVRLRR